jgi:hypothetical protein
MLHSVLSTHRVMDGGSVCQWARVRHQRAIRAIPETACPNDAKCGSRLRSTLCNGSTRAFDPWDARPPKSALSGTCIGRASFCPWDCLLAVCGGIRSCTRAMSCRPFVGECISVSWLVPTASTESSEVLDGIFLFWPHTPHGFILVERQ